MSDVTVTVRSDQLPSTTTTVTVRQNQISSVEVIPCQSFRFLDLPAELRVQVYEEVVVVGKVFYTPERIEAQNERRFKDWKLYRKPQLQLLRVCKTIHQEAEKVYLSKNLFVLPTEFYAQAPFVLEWNPRDRPSEYRWLFSTSAFTHLKNVSVGFSPVTKGRLTSSYIDFEKKNTDSRPRIVYSRLDAVGARRIEAHDEAREDFEQHCDSIRITLDEEGPLLIDARLPYIELDFTGGYCPLGCCRHMGQNGLYFLTFLLPLRTVVLGLNFKGEEQLFLNELAHGHCDYFNDSGPDDWKLPKNWGSPAWARKEYGVEFKTEHENWIKWKMDA
jgi:hypothetical protein